jgi:methyl-accepting chemotaxis protein
MDEGAVGRAKERVEQRAESAAFEALIVRAREQVDALADAATSFEEMLPTRVGDAVREQAQPVGRNLAEIRGLMNQVIRRLERVEADLLVERSARIDDLSLLVDLTTSGWQGVDARLSRIEDAFNRLEHGIQENRGAIVYRMEDRRPDAASS